MRVIHTSDWHLGQLFYEYERGDEHDRFLDWLLQTIASERADALLVAGDIFDHANPSAASQKQLYHFLTQAKRRSPHLNIVLVSGNHDSPGRIEAPAPLLDELGIIVVGQVARTADGAVDAERLCVPLKDARGRTAAWCLAVPFLRSGDLPAAAPEPPAVVAAAAESAGHVELAALPAFGGAGAAYVAGVARLYEDALRCALLRRNDGQPVVALGHCHVEGCAVSGDSERPIVAGGLDAITRDVFGPGLAYVALGHLHRPQQATGDGRVRYSGSPLPLSFSEIDYPHQVLAVDLDGAGLADVRAIRVPRFAELVRVPAAPAPVDEAVAALRAHDFAAVDGLLPPYLEVRVRLDGPQPGLRARIDEALADKPVRLARIETSYPPRAAADSEPAAASLEDLGRLSPEDIFRQRYRSRYGDEVPADLVLAFGELLRDAAREDRA